jgi:Uma2 family endonuclease
MFTVPLDVCFPGADPVQPDIMAMLPGWTGTLSQRGPHGSPDLVVEVISPANRSHDLITKRAHYGRAEVREYSLVDPAARAVEILQLGRDAFCAAHRAAGDETVASPLHSDTTFPLASIFAGVGETAD